MTTRTTIPLAALLVLGSLSAVRSADDPSPEPPADVTCKLVSGTGTLTASSGPRGTLVRISGPGYTGNATCTFGKVSPSRMKFHFAGTRGMQTFRISDGKHNYTSQLVGVGGKTTTYFDRLGRTVTEPTLAAVTLVLETTKAGDVEATVSTARGVDLGKELKVHWMQYLMLKR
jgi:hypothetical protein